MKKYLLRFTDEEQSLYERLKAVAKNNRRSFGNQIIRAIEYFLENAPEARAETKREEKEVAKKKSPK